MYETHSPESGEAEDLAAVVAQARRSLRPHQHLEDHSETYNKIMMGKEEEEEEEMKSSHGKRKIPLCIFFHSAPWSAETESAFPFAARRA